MHTTVLRVRYAETDRAGVVYHANYLSWFDVGRTEYLRDLGQSYASFEREQELLLTVAEAHLRYLAPACYDDRVVIGTRLGEVRRVRFRLEHRLWREATGQLLCTGHVVLACITRAGRPKPLPRALLEGLRAGQVDDVGKRA